MQTLTTSCNFGARTAPIGFCPLCRTCPRSVGRRIIVNLQRSLHQSRLPHPECSPSGLKEADLAELLCRRVSDYFPQRYLGIEVAANTTALSAVSQNCLHRSEHSIVAGRPRNVLKFETRRAAIQRTMHALKVGSRMHPRKVRFPPQNQILQYVPDSWHNSLLRATIVTCVSSSGRTCVCCLPRMNLPAMSPKYHAYRDFPLAQRPEDPSQ